MELQYFVISSRRLICFPYNCGDSVLVWHTLEVDGPCYLHCMSNIYHGIASMSSPFDIASNYHVRYIPMQKFNTFR